MQLHHCSYFIVRMAAAVSWAELTKRPLWHGCSEWNCPAQSISTFLSSASRSQAQIHFAIRKRMQTLSGADLMITTRYGSVSQRELPGGCWCPFKIINNVNNSINNSFSRHTLGFSIIVTQGTSQGQRVTYAMLSHQPLQQQLQDHGGKVLYGGE